MIYGKFVALLFANSWFSILAHKVTETLSVFGKMYGN